MRPIRYLFEQAAAVLREEGPGALLSKGSRKARTWTVDAAWSLPLVWRWALDRSTTALNRRESPNDDLANILETAYTFDGVGLYRSLKPFQRRDELTQLCKLVPRSDVDTLVEIGTARGGTLYVLTRQFEPSTLISIDVNNSAKRTAFFDAFTPEDTTFVQASSYDPETVDRVKAFLDGRPVDLLFIDGDHRYDAVTQDYEYYSSLVADGGWICLDDIRQEHRPGIDVYEFWAELQERTDTTEILREADQKSCGIGLVDC